ncbi:MAG: DUF1552 domain-containing protein [Planctomycetota bacterium]
MIPANTVHRRRFIRDLGVSAAAANFLFAMPSLGWAAAGKPKQRLIFVFSPNGVIPKHFWPETTGRDFEIKRILKPLEPFREQLLTLRGVHNQIKGDGDGHMRGIGCLLTGIELFPGDVQGGSDTPAGWSMGISVDQYLKNKLQADAATATRFGSLEFGVLVPDRADTWTRWSYAGANQPVAPISDPYQMFDKLYGQSQNQEMLASVLDGLKADFDKVKPLVSSEDRVTLDRHVDMIRDVERDLQREMQHASGAKRPGHAVPELPANIADNNDNMPMLCKMQCDLLASALASDFARVATFQITNSVGNPRMSWLGIDGGHHGISHEPDSNKEAYENLIRINTWYAEQVAYLAKRLADTPEPGGDGSLLDNTTIVWTNELGKGNSHTRNNIPFVMVGGGLGFQTGRAFHFGGVPHNRLLMTLAAAMGHPVDKFGNPDYCGEGVLTGLS